MSDKAKQTVQNIRAMLLARYRIREIAKTLHVSTWTVKEVRRAIYRERLANRIERARSPKAEATHCNYCGRGEPERDSRGWSEGKLQLSDLNMRDLGVGPHGRVVYELTRSLKARLTWQDGCLLIHVPPGTRTDMASVPRFFWRLFPPTGRYNPAAVIHDYLCRNPGCSRFLADALFREIMRQLKVPLWQRVLMFYAVRLGALWQRKQSSSSSEPSS